MKQQNGLVFNRIHFENDVPLEKRYQYLLKITNGFITALNTVSVVFVETCRCLSYRGSRYGAKSSKD